MLPKIENKVIVRFRDGRIVKGYTHNFDPHGEIFHVSQSQYEKEVMEVPISLAKAVFFVKTFEGCSDHASPEDFSMESLKSIPGLKVEVAFLDGEVLYGSTHGYALNRKGFFICPADKEGNNQRVFVVRDSTVSVETWR